VGSHRQMVRASDVQNLSRALDGRCHEYVIALPEGSPSRPSGSAHRPPPTRQQDRERRPSQVHVPSQHSGNRGPAASSEHPSKSCDLHDRAMAQVRQVRARDEQALASRAARSTCDDLHRDRRPLRRVPEELTEIPGLDIGDLESRQHGQSERSPRRAVPSSRRRGSVDSRAVKGALPWRRSPSASSARWRCEHHSSRDHGFLDPVSEGVACSPGERHLTIGRPGLLENDDVGIHGPAPCDHVERATPAVDAAVHVPAGDDDFGGHRHRSLRRACSHTGDTNLT